MLPMVSPEEQTSFHAIMNDMTIIPLSKLEKKKYQGRLIVL